MMIAYEVGTAAILKRLGLGAERATTHAEWTTRKIDPAGPNGNRVAVWSSDPRGARNATWDPNAWRAAVDGWLAPPPVEVVPDPPAPPTEEADDMPVLHLISQTKGEWLWTPGGSPQPFKSQADALAIVGGIEADRGRKPTRVNVSDEQLVALQNERPA